MVLIFNPEKVEELSRALHEAGATVAAERHGEKTRTFIEWDDLTEKAREGRRIQARYLIERYDITPKKMEE